MRTVTALVACALILGAVGCADMKKSIGEAKGLTDQFLQSQMAGGDLQKTLPFYSPKFFEAAGGKDKWQGELESTARYYGPVKSWSYYTEFKYENKVGTNEALPGRKVELKVDVVCEKATAVEEFTLYKPADGSSGWVIIAHHITPKNPLTATRPAP